MRPQSPTVSTHRNDSEGIFQALIERNNPSFSRKQAHDYLRHFLTTQQLFAVQAQQEIHDLTSSDMPQASMSAHERITDKGASTLIFEGKLIRRGLLYPKHAEPEAQISITRGQAFTALLILDQLRRWSAARGCRMVLFTHSALWGRSADKSKGIEEHHGALYGSCGETQYKLALKLLALIGMPVLQVNHEDAAGKLTDESRCLAVILPALPRNANVDRSISLPAASLERILAPGAQMTFAALAADPGDPEKLDAARSCDPPQSSTAPRVRIGRSRNPSSQPAHESTLAEAHLARRPNHLRSAESNLEGLTGEVAAILRGSGPPPRFVISSQRPEDLARAPDWRLLRALWNESLHLTRASLYGSQIPTLTRQVSAICNLLGTKAFIKAARDWIASIDHEFHFGDGSPPHFSWSFAFLRQLTYQAHRDILNQPSNAPTLEQRHNFGHALNPELFVIGERAANFELLALTPSNAAGDKFAIVSGDHRAWQLVMHHPAGAELVADAALVVGATGFVFVGHRQIDLAKTRQLVRSARNMQTRDYLRPAPAKAPTTIPDVAARWRSALEIFNNSSPTPLPAFLLTHPHGRRFEVDLAEGMTDDWFAMRYRRIYSDLIRETFKNELGGSAPELTIINACQATRR